LVEHLQNLLSSCLIRFRAVAPLNQIVNSWDGLKILKEESNL
jgi:hypothetical protein